MFYSEFFRPPFLFFWFSSLFVLLSPLCLLDFQFICPIFILLVQTRFLWLANFRQSWASDSYQCKMFQKSFKPPTIQVHWKQDQIYESKVGMDIWYRNRQSEFYKEYFLRLLIGVKGCGKILYCGDCKFCTVNESYALWRKSGEKKLWKLWKASPLLCSPLHSAANSSSTLWSTQQGFIIISKRSSKLFRECFGLSGGY